MLFSFFELIIVLSLALVGLEVWRAHKNHLSLKEQFAADKIAGKAELDALKAELAALKDKLKP